MNYLPVLIGGIEILVLLTAFFVAAVKDWGGPDAQPNECLEHVEDTCFCEKVGGRFNVRQRSNTWSNVADMVAGLLILGMLSFSSSSASQNPMQGVTFYSVLFGALVIFLGPASMFFHASLTKWGGWLDNLSMNLFITFILGYTLAQLLIVNDLTRVLIFSGFFLIANIGAGVYSWQHERSGAKIFKYLFFSTLVVQVLVCVPVGFYLRVQRDWHWFAVGGGLFFIAWLVWSQSETGGRLCRKGNIFGWFSPTSWVQGHAIWHIVNAVAAFAIFLFLRTEMIH